MILLIIFLTIWIILILLAIGLCLAARLGDLQRSDDPDRRARTQASRLHRHDR
jgi:hypothetical protein